MVDHNILMSWLGLWSIRHVEGEISTAANGSLQIWVLKRGLRGYDKWMTLIFNQQHPKHHINGS